MKTYIISLIILISSITLCAKENNILAKVDTYEITEYQVNALVTAKLQKTFFHQKLPEDKKKELNEKALNELIERELLYRYAKDENILVNQNIISEKKEIVLKKFPSIDKFEEVLKANNLTVEILERDIDAEETMNLLYDKRIKSIISEEDLSKYYELNKHKFLKPESKSFQILLINVDPTQKDAIKVAKKRITELRVKIEQGEDFAKIALENSDDMSKINGGKVGFVHKGTFQYLKEKDLNLKINELSPVIQTDIGFYVVKLLEVKKEEQLAFETVKENLKKELRTSEEKKKLNIILTKQKEKITIKFF